MPHCIYFSRLHILLLHTRHSDLWCVLDAAVRARTLASIRLSRNKLALLKRALHIEMVPNLVQRLSLTSDSNTRTVLRSERILDLRCGVRLLCGRLDAGLGKPLVRGQLLEQRDGPLDVVGCFLAGLVIGVAASLKGADASAVLVPLVFPEGLVITVLANPVLVHVRECRVAEELGHNRLDICVLTALITELRVRAVAVIRPKTMNGP